MATRTIKNILGFFFWCLFSGVVLMVTIATVIANYASLAVAFILSGADKRPLAFDPFLGHSFRILSPEASIAEYYAATLAIGIAIVYFLLAKEAFGAFDSYLAMRLHRADRNDAQATAFKWDLVEKLGTLVVLALLLVGIASWEVELFRFRSTAGAAGIEDAQAAVQLAPWQEQLATSSFAIELAQIGAWGYLSVTGSLAFGIEVTARKAHRYADRFFAEIEAGVGDPKTEPATGELLGYDAAEQPVYAPNTDPAIELAYDAQGNSIGTAATAVAAEPVTAEAGTEQHAEPQAGERAPLFVVPNLGRAAESEPKPQAQRAAEAAGAAEPARQAEAAAEYTVIGTGEKVTWAAAVQDTEKYYADLKTHTVYDRRTYEALHGGEPQAA